MSESEEKQKIQKITTLLEKGGTMLANHHDCGAPMFRYMGKIVCPVCDIGTENPAQSGKHEVADNVQTTGKNPPHVDSKGGNKPQSRVDEHSGGEIETQITNKVHSLAGGLEDETDLQRLKSKMECIELGIRILELLKK